MTLTELRARLKELVGDMDKAIASYQELAAKQVAAPADDADEATKKAYDEHVKALAAGLKAIEDKTSDIERVEQNIDVLEKAEQIRARTAKPADAPVAEPGVPALPKKDLDAAEKISILMAGMVTALHEEGTKGFRPTMKAMSERGYDALTREFAPMQGKALNSGQASAGGILLPETMSNDVIDLLRNNATFLAGGPTVIPMPNGTYKQPKAASGATAAYRGETARKSVSQPSFKAINMSAKLLAGIVPISNQLIRWSGPNIGDWARMDLSSAMGLKLDYMAYFGDGSEDTPIGLLNIPGVSTYAATGDASPTYTQVDSDCRKLLTPIESYGDLVKSVAWRMAPRVFNYLADLRDGLGNLIYPTLQGNSPTFKGYPVMKTTQFPITLGDTTDESYIMLVAFGHVLFGDALRMQLAISDQASIVSGADTIHAFQQGMTLIAAEAEHDFDVRYVEAVQVLTGVRWGA